LRAKSFTFLREAAWDVGVAHVLADDGTVLAFDQCVVVGLSGAGLGQFDAQVIEHARHPMVDVFTAVVGVETLNDEGEGVEDPRKRRQQVALADAFHDDDGLSG
jgi:hypothetical protein